MDYAKIFCLQFNWFSVLESSAVSSFGNESAEAAYVFEETSADAVKDSGQTFAEIFDKYKAYGITYSESDGERNVYYKGNLVHKFTDIAPDGGAFSFTSSKEGGINVKTVYSDSMLCDVEKI